MIYKYIISYGRCPYCGSWAWDGRRCWDCGAGSSVWEDER